MAIDTGRTVAMGGGFTLYAFAYTHTAGDANETIVVHSGRVFAAIISSQESGGRYTSNPCRFRESISGLLNTVTIETLVPISAGRLVLIVLSGQ